MADWPPDDYPLPADDEQVLMELWWRRARVFRADIEAEIAHMVNERGWLMPTEDDADEHDQEEE